MGENPSHFSKCGDDCPVEKVNFTDATLFIKRLNKKTGKEYRLPSEAEWEYACRAGGKDEYCGGNDASKVGWHEGNSGGETSSVAGKQPNAWGLYDMSGNVWEWTQDCWNDSHEGASADGSARESGYCSKHVVRGGSWSLIPSSLRAAYRLNFESGTRFSNGGSESPERSRSVV